MEAYRCEGGGPRNRDIEKQAAPETCRRVLLRRVAKFADRGESREVQGIRVGKRKKCRPPWPKDRGEEEFVAPPSNQKKKCDPR